MRQVIYSWAGGGGNAVSKAPLAKIRSPVITTGAGDAVSIGPSAKIHDSVITARATHMASVLPEEPVYRDNTLPLSFRIRVSYWACVEWLAENRTPVARFFKYLEEKTLIKIIKNTLQ